MNTDFSYLPVFMISPKNLYFSQILKMKKRTTFFSLTDGADVILGIISSELYRMFTVASNNNK